MARVLIVDDSPTETHKISRILDKHGHEVLTAENGEEGVMPQSLFNVHMIPSARI